MAEGKVTMEVHVDMVSRVVTHHIDPGAIERTAIYRDSGEVRINQDNYCGKGQTVHLDCEETLLATAQACLEALAARHARKVAQ